MDQYVKAQETAKAVPPDVDVNALIAFKQKRNRKSLKQKANMKRPYKNRHSSIVTQKNQKTGGYKS